MEWFIDLSFHSLQPFHDIVFLSKLNILRSEHLKDNEKVTKKCSGFKK